MERWTTETPASIPSAGGRGLDDIISPLNFPHILYNPSSLSLCSSLFPPFLLSGPQTQTVSFFFCLLLSLSLSLPSVFFISYTSRPPLLLHSSLFLMCCFPVEFGCLTLYNSVMQMFASSTVVLWREIQCQ